MIGESTPTRARRRHPAWLKGVTGLSILIAAGCGPEYRISYEQFLQTRHVARARVLAKAEQVSAAPAPTKPYLGPYQVGSGDVLRLTFSGAGGTAPIPPIDARVSRQGEIDLPIVGAVNVADLELEGVEKAIRAAYVPAVFQDTVIHADVVNADTTNVLVAGAIGTPGLVRLERNQRNLLFAIAGAGGVSELASGKATLRRIRRPDEVRTFDLTDPVQLREALDLPPLEQGDIVYVHATQPLTVFVGGLVNRAGAQEYPPDTEITLLQALAAAGGLRPDLFPREGTLVRRMPDGTDAHVKLDLRRLAHGEVKNIALAAGDILWVPHTWDTRVQEFVNRNIFLRAGISVNYNVTGIEFLNRHSQQSSGLGGGGGLQDAFDPFGFLGQNAALQGIQNQLPP